MQPFLPLFRNSRISPIAHRTVQWLNRAKPPAGPKAGSQVTTDNPTPQPKSMHIALADLDLTPEGLADAPAQRQDPDSIVHTGNS